MSEHVQQELLGYLLGALDQPEREELEARLAADPRLRRQLARVRKSLRPLETDAWDVEPPPGLAARTAAWVAAQAAACPAGAGGPRRPAGAEAGTGRTGAPLAAPSAVLSWAPTIHWPDVAVAAGILVTATLLIFPAIERSRLQARKVACQNNLREVGRALDEYSQSHDGYFPVVPVQGRLAAAGIYAPTLLSQGYLREARSDLCPGGPVADGAAPRIPTLVDLQGAGED